MGDKYERGPLTRRRRTTISETASSVLNSKQANGSKPGNAGEASSVNHENSPLKVRNASTTPRKDKSYNDAIKERLR